MARIDEKRKQRLEQAIRDMGNYGVKLRKPEELPDFDQPSDYEEEKRRFEPVDKVEEQNDKESNEDFSQPSYQETALSPTERATSTEEFHQRMGKTKDRKQLSEFQGKYLQPFRNSHRKAVYVSEEMVVSLKVCNSSFLSLYFHCYFILFFPVFELIYSPFICRLCFLHRHGCQEEDDRLL